MSGIILRSGGGQSAPATSVGIPVGAILHWSGLTAPMSWLLLDGVPWLRSAHPVLWAFAQSEIAAGNQFFNTGNGSTTFGTRDCRGEFVRMADGGRGVDPGRVMGTAQGDSTRLLINGSSVVNAPAGNSPTGVIAHKPGIEAIGIDSFYWGQYTQRNSLAPAMDSRYGNANESRGRNVAVNFIIFAGV